MYITWLELKKAFLSPVLLILLCTMIGFNVLQIWSESQHKEELTVVNEIIETYGTTFNDDVLQQMEQDLDASIQLLGGNDAQSFFEQMEYDEEVSLIKRQEIERLHLIYTYVQAAKTLAPLYETVNIPQLKEEFIKEQQMPKWLERKMVGEFDRWQQRYEEIVATNEHKQWFFLNTYRMHSYLFKTEIKTLALEAVLLVVLLTTFITNYEFDKKTQLVVYCTKKGRKLIWHKGFASVIGTILIILLLFGSTLSFYFTVYDYSALWQSSISSALNWEYNLPYINWAPMPLWKYLLCTIGILSALLLIVCMITFVISTLIKNTYLTWCISILLIVSMFVLPFYFTNSTAQWFMQFNIPLLLLNPHQYFNGGMTYMMMQYHELYTLIMWGTIAILSSLMAIRFFHRKDVV